MQTRIEDRAALYGAESLTECELIESVSGAKPDKVRAAYDQAGGLRKLIAAGSSPHLTPFQFAKMSNALELTRRHYAELMQAGSVLTNPRATREYLRMKLRDLSHEVFCCLYLDNRNRVTAYEELFRGTVDGATVHPREVVKAALRHNAAAVILAHNHPSGVAEPSQADELITRRLKEALAVVDIRVLDHLVIGDGTCESFAERGIL